MNKFKKEIFINVTKLFIKYVLPVLLGWLEGDTHTVQELVTNLLKMF